MIEPSQSLVCFQMLGEPDDQLKPSDGFHAVSFAASKQGGDVAGSAGAASPRPADVHREPSSVWYGAVLSAVGERLCSDPCVFQE